MSEQETWRLTFREFDALRKRQLEAIDLQNLALAQFATLYIKGHKKEASISPDAFLLRPPKRKPSPSKPLTEEQQKALAIAESVIAANRR